MTDIFGKFRWKISFASIFEFDRVRKFDDQDFQDVDNLTSSKTLFYHLRFVPSIVRHAIVHTA